MRRLLLVLPGAVASPVFLVIGRALDESASNMTVAMITCAGVLIVIAAHISVQVLSEHLWTARAWPKALEVLRRILMTASQSQHDSLKPTTIARYAEYEDRLSEGATVYTLTHDLFMYDCVDEALNVIVDNLRQGVVYKYFLAADDARKMCDDFRRKLNDCLLSKLRTEGADESTILRERHSAFANLSCRRVRQPLLYSFSVTERVGEWGDAHWYAATPKVEERGDSELAILYIKEHDQVRALKMLFIELERWHRSAALRPRRDDSQIASVGLRRAS